MNVLHVKRMLYYQRGAFSGLELYVSHEWQVIIQSMHESHLLRHHILRTFGHKTTPSGNLVSGQGIPPVYRRAGGRVL